MTTPAVHPFTAYFDTAYATVPVMAILRGYSPERTVELCTRAWDLGLTQVEVPIQTPDAVPSLEAAVAAARERGAEVGAGTVTTPEQVDLAHRVGAVFTVAPGFDPDVIARSVELAVPHVPGVSTPSEIQQAAKLGLTWVKAFPASVLGPAWIKAVLAPFPGVRIVATGGINAANAAEYLDAGARVVSLGSALEDPSQLDRVAALLTGPLGRAQT
ncbi:bifunctional 4-hydroxy-2-oxoglutarate aldolase/2-dehydro-3-deoxy-phosphogluconate aldolase [Occultella kanbiaonis]|uniref:bifunctional 4-hydroxy-2-oxoglutarate aldolase/2-dehydro-3-deoxy-phosphogluconate aldolase n=1 Tax=Occultella kanbiaonis TaxID=2675754 RepID=UPI001F2DBA6F|nr:bifunctional 4-hydroxy-2-oxoglutarate aldolase/2-dehydro-3-deoxy-phosphogluconate aldolase [Occultella kanbiaonis]